MSKRGRKKKLKFNIKSETIKSVSAVFLILFGSLSTWSLIAPSYNLTSVFDKYLKLFLGIGSYIFPLAIIFTGILMIWPINRRFLNLRITIALYLVFILIASIGESLALGYGGKLGFFVSNLLTVNIGYVGNLIVLFLSFFAVLIFLTDIPTPMVHSLLERFSNKKVSEDVEVENDLEGIESEEEDDTYQIGDNIYTQVPSLSSPVEDNIIAPVSITNNSPKNKTNKSSQSPFEKISDTIWEYPPLNLLDEPDKTPIDSGDVKENKKIIEETFGRFDIDCKVIAIQPGPTITQYSLELLDIAKLSQATNLGPNLAMALKSPSGSVRMQAPIPGTNLIGIEVPNRNRIKVSIKTLLNSEKMKNSNEKLNIVIGLDVAGKAEIYNISKMPHMLVAGATGTGKSVFLHTILFSILFRNSPSECKLIIIDPKEVDFSRYEGIPHLISPIITDPKVVPNVFKWLSGEMARRYKLLRTAGASNIEEYNERAGFQAMPNIVVLVEEYADIMLTEGANEIEKGIQALAQKARAAGIHLVIATQRPSRDVINGTLKANIPCKISFAVNGQVDSRVILDQPGAEKLLGKGDMLFLPQDYTKPVRIQAPMVSKDELSKLIEYLKNQGIEPEYNSEVTTAPTPILAGGNNVNNDGVDELYEVAKEYVISAQRASASLLQTKLGIGFNRAARLLQQLENTGIVGPQNGAKPRTVLIKNTNNELIDAFNEDLEEQELNDKDFAS